MWGFYVVSLNWCELEVVSVVSQKAGRRLTMWPFPQSDETQHKFRHLFLHFSTAWPLFWVLFLKYIHYTLVPCLSESFHYCLFFTHTEKACKNNSLMHLLLINKTYNVEHMTMIWMHSSEICSDIKNFLLVEVSSQAVCSSMLGLCISVHVGKKCNCKQQHDCFSQPGFPHWNCRFNVRGDHSNAEQQCDIFHLSHV